MLSFSIYRSNGLDENSGISTKDGDTIFTSVETEYFD